ncbi:MAG: DUF5331 domain-containing protein [Calothrix sp. MO_167.B12]|nr:DUF5331 domain-containing protein [Calothrix sp. MO_167.B12]
MNIQELRQSLKLKWLNYYHKNQSWLVKMRIWGTYDGERRPSSGFILAALSILEPQLEQAFPFILELSNNPDQIISALGLNFNPEQQLHLVDSNQYHNTDRDERSLWQDLVYDRQADNGHISHPQIADEQPATQNIQLMTMVADEEVINQPISSSIAVEQLDKPLSGFGWEEAETVGVLVNQGNTTVKSTVEEFATPIHLPTRVTQAVATVSEYPISPPAEPLTEKVPQSVPLHSFMLDERTGIFHQPPPTLSNVQQPSQVESPAYTLGETICVPSLAMENYSGESSKLENSPELENDNNENEEDVSSQKKKHFNLASWIDDFCQGRGWDREDAIFIPF